MGLQTGTKWGLAPLPPLPERPLLAVFKIIGQNLTCYKDIISAETPRIVLFLSLVLFKTD